MSLEKPTNSHFKALAVLAALAAVYNADDAGAIQSEPLQQTETANNTTPETEKIPFALLKAQLVRKNNVLLNGALRDLLQDDSALEYLIRHLNYEKNRELLAKAYEMNTLLHEKILSKLNFFGADTNERLNILKTLPSSILFSALTGDSELQALLFGKDMDILSEKMKDDKYGSVFVFLKRELSIIGLNEDLIKLVTKSDEFVAESVRSVTNASSSVFWEFITYINSFRFSPNKTVENFSKVYLNALNKNIKFLREIVYNKKPYVLDKTFLDLLKGNLSETDARLIAVKIFTALDKEVILNLLREDEFFVLNLSYFRPLVQYRVWSSISPDKLTEILNENIAFADVFTEALLDNKTGVIDRKLFFDLNDEQLLLLLKKTKTPRFWNLLREKNIAEYLANVLNKLSLNDIKSKLSNSLHFLYNAQQLLSKPEVTDKKVLDFINNTINEIVDSKNYKLLSAGPSTVNLLLWEKKFWIKRLGKDFYLKTLLNSAFNSPLRAAENIEKRSYTDNDTKNALLRGIVKFVNNGFSENVTKKSERYKYNILMRTINHLHASEHTKWRQVILKNMSAMHRYWLSVNGISEVFTSTSSYVNYILPMIFEDLKSQKDGLKAYLTRFDPSLSGLGTFILVVARYDKLDEFMRISKLDNPTYILKQLLNANMNVDNAQAIIKLLLYAGSNKGDKWAKSMELELYRAYKNARGEDDVLARKLSTLASLYAHTFSVKSADSELTEWFGSASRKEKITIPDKMSFKDLFRKEGKYFVHRQAWFFLEGGDKDGIKSRWSAIARLKRAGFKKIEIKSLAKTSRSVDATPLLYRKTFGKKMIELWLSPIIDIDKLSEYSSPSRLLSENLFEYLRAGKVDGLAYRGHSTYVLDMARLLKRIDLPENSHINIFNLGSCGGASSIQTISNVLPVSVSAWIATEGTGSSDINDPIFVSLLNEILRVEDEAGETLNFVDFEKKMKRRFANNKLFQSYKMPHSNFPAILDFHFRSIEKEVK